MKRKIICLAICVACLIATLASCGSKPNACTTHVDTDKNSVCDGCGIPVITITEKVPTEQEIVNMIVAAIPNGATLGDVYATTTEKDSLTGEFEAKENFKDDQIDMLSDNLIAYHYLTQTKGTETTKENWTKAEDWTGTDPYDANGYLKDDKYTVTFAVYDILAKKDVLSFTSEECALNDEHVTMVNDIDLDSNTGLFIKVTTKTWTKSETSNTWTSKLTDAYYFKNGTLFSDEAKTAKGDTFYSPAYVETVANAAYYKVNKTMYAFDTDTCATLASGPVNTFVKRPVFNYATDNYGVVINGNKYFVYDLSKWIECVYSYEAPGNAQVFVLNNGNLLVQQSVILPNSAVNYDYTDGAYKYDLVHTIVDISAKTETNLEFGYYVTGVTTIDEDDTVYSDGYKNTVNVQTIVNKNLSSALTLACNDAFSIIADVNDVLPSFVSNVTLVADGVFLGTVVYGEGSSVRKLYNAKGEELSTLPNGATLYGTYIVNDGKFYDFTMKLILDPKADEENPFVVSRMFGDYVILTQNNDYYYWNAASTAPVKIVDTTNVEKVPSTDNPEVLVDTTPNPLKEQTLVTANKDYYVVKTTTTTTTEVEGSTPEVETTTEYVVYNAAGTEVFKSEKAVNVVSQEIDDNKIWIITSDDVIYLAK